MKRCIDGRMYREGEAPGLMFGRAVADGRDLWSYWRDGMVVEMGPGSGKTTGIAIPLIVDAPGVVVATSNKRDLPDGVRSACEQRGTCWVFDPQRIADYTGGKPPAWWWNPLEGITGPVEAASLARVFADASAPPESSKNAYFDTAGPQLLANLILAAAVLGRQLDQVYLWIADPGSALREAVPALKDNGYPLPGPGQGRRPVGSRQPRPKRRRGRPRPHRPVPGSLRRDPRQHLAGEGPIPEMGTDRRTPIQPDPARIPCRSRRTSQPHPRRTGQGTRHRSGASPRPPGRDRPADRGRQLIGGRLHPTPAR